MTYRLHRPLQNSRVAAASEVARPRPLPGHLWQRAVGYESWAAAEGWPPLGQAAPRPPRGCPRSLARPTSTGGTGRGTSRSPRTPGENQGEIPLPQPRPPRPRRPPGRWGGRWAWSQRCRRCCCYCCSLWATSCRRRLPSLA